MCSNIVEWKWICGATAENLFKSFLFSLGLKFCLCLAVSFPPPNTASFLLFIIACYSRLFVTIVWITFYGYYYKISFQWFSFITVCRTQRNAAMPSETETVKSILLLRKHLFLTAKWYEYIRRMILTSKFTVCCCCCLQRFKFFPVLYDVWTDLCINHKKVYTKKHDGIDVIFVIPCFLIRFSPSKAFNSTNTDYHLNGVPAGG